MERVVTIGGGGLAGLSLGIALRQTRTPVILHEAGVYPRHRVCGEFISGVSPAVLETLGIADLVQDAQRHVSGTWYFRDRKIYNTRLPSAVGISRLTLDERLAVRFRELDGILKESSRIKEKSGPGIVWCAGRKSVRGHWIGLKCHVSGLDLSADLEMHLAANGYLGLARIAEDKVNVCGLFRLEPKLAGKGVRTLERYLHAGGLEGIAGRIFSADVDEGSFLGVAGFSLGRPATNCNTILTLGDAWGMIPPFTGNGMSMAFESAAIALEPLRSWQRGRETWEQALSRIQRRLAERFGGRMFWARMIHPFLTTTTGQAFFTMVSRSGLLPFRACVQAVR
jgi:flavin-dependent dehydrogenase